MGKKTGNDARRNDAASDASGAVPGAPTVDWESRVLSRVRPHVRELRGPGAAQAGWETDTLTRLEDYFDRDEV
jgi:hypothetical protein